MFKYMNVCSYVHTLKCCHSYKMNIYVLLFKMLPWLQDEYLCNSIQNVATATLINNRYHMNMCSYVPLLVYYVLSKMLPWLQKLKM